MTQLTRVATDLAASTIGDSMEALELAADSFGAVATRLTAKERQRMLKPPHAFADAARAMIEMASADAPELAAACKFDGEAVLEDLDNASLLIPLIARLKSLLRLAEDTRLQWLGEAYTATLPLYRVAAVRAQDDGDLQSVVGPLHEVYAAGAADGRGVADRIAAAATKAAATGDSDESDDT